MIRPRQVRLKLNKSQFQQCQQLSQESARVWNATKNFFWRTYRKKGIWLSESSLKRYIGGRFSGESEKMSALPSSLCTTAFSLHSQSIQAVIEKFCDNLKTAHTLRKENPSIRYPYKNKNWLCVHWKKSAIQVVEGSLQRPIEARSLPRDFPYIQLSNGKGRQRIVFKLPADLTSGESGCTTAFNCQPNCVELIWRNGYWLSITLFFSGKLMVICGDKPACQVLGFSTAAVDMGEIHAITITDGKESTVISGRELRSVKRKRNKRVAKLSSLQSRCKSPYPLWERGKIDSRRFKRLQAVKSKVMAECHRRTRDLNHKITRIAVDWCVEHNVGKLVIGDVSGISKNTKNEKRLNKKNRQKVSQWAFYQQRQYLEYKCKEVGTGTILEPENLTSKTCPKCEFTNAKGLWGININQQDETTIVQPVI